MSGKKHLSEWELLKILHPTPYSGSEEEYIGMNSDDEYIQPHCSSSEEEYVPEEKSVTDNAPAPTSYAKRTVVQRDAVNTFSLFIDKFIVDTIIKCPLVEARSKTGKRRLEYFYRKNIWILGQPVD
ncbi:unnamed protein product [Lepeophtheirus salmonis]|uniref:(salmon louse) hypothetical protein n=1 Tax=Lepeophtheirus salmonis TaxID=72036 RepID=A0A7R8H5V4_LEPSM|nr:unnamed protein product [Lepeophtheirus salmonis]CAF2874357.1 unnamed protein product [Lepeophtheirus salmonis]